MQQKPYRQYLLRALGAGLAFFLISNLIDFAFAYYGAPPAANQAVMWKWGAFHINGEVHGEYFNSGLGLFKLFGFTAIMFGMYVLTHKTEPTDPTADN